MKVETMAGPFRDWMGKVAYYLMREGGTAYGLFLHHARVVASPRLVADQFIIASGVTDKGELRLRIHTPSLKSLELPVASELLKVAIMPMVFGQFGSRRKELITRYGSTIYHIAAALSVSRFVDTKLLKEHGFQLPCLEDYDLKDGYDIGTSWYCAALYGEKSGDNYFTQLLHKCPKYVEAYANFPTVVLDRGKKEDQDEAVPAAKRSRPEAPFVVVEEMDHLPSESIDLFVHKELEQIRAEVDDREARRYSSNTSRGWDSADSQAFIKQVKRKPRMPWFAKLRKLETRYRSQERTVSKLRPSRRHPLHFGRIKKSALLVWFGVDTSGSMGSNELEVVNAELKGIHNRGAVIRVLHSDAAIQATSLYNPHEGVKQFYGRGGTDFSPFLIQLHNSEVEKPGFAVFYTDGHGCIAGYKKMLKDQMGVKGFNDWLKSFPTRTPRGVEILWLLTERGRSLSCFKTDVPFGNYAILPSAKGEGDDKMCYDSVD